MAKQRYAKAGPIGGALIRKVIAALRPHFSLPLSSDILVSVSAGSDSTALAHLLVHLGRRLVPKHRIRLVHVNHGWRGEASVSDEQWLRALAKRWEVPITVHRGPLPQDGVSWEAQAREFRQRVYASRTEELGLASPRVFTAHHADDLAETLLWRLLTGAAQTHGGGIQEVTEFEVRPLLRVRKQVLLDYLQECEQGFCVDATNFEERFLRSQMRARLMPELERLFPQAVNHLVQAGLQAQAKGRRKQLVPEHLGPDPLGKDDLLASSAEMFQMLGIRPKRAYFQALEQGSEVQLAGQWRLYPLAQSQGSGERNKPPCAVVQSKEKWILEKI